MKIQVLIKKYQSNLGLLIDLKNQIKSIAQKGISVSMEDSKKRLINKNINKIKNNI